MSAHSRIPPSSAHIWAGGGCTGWVQMIERFPEPEEESDEAREGTASHEVGKLSIDRGLRGGIGPELVVGSVASNGVVITEEMADCAEIYSDDVIGEYKARLCKGGIRFKVEERVACPLIHPESFGTPDAWLYDPHESLLIIWDYKYGHVVVDAFENWQEANYASGIVDLLDEFPREVEFRVVQPRAIRRKGIFARWRVPYDGLIPMFETLQTRAAEALSESPVCKTGPHCRRCGARYGCDAALQAGLGLYEVASEPLPVDLSPTALGLQLAIVTRAIEALQGLETGYQEQVMALVKAGGKVPWWSLESVAGREAWTRPVQEVAALGDLLGLKLRKDALITPNQARKLGMDNAIISQYAGRSSGTKLTFDSGEKARKIFE